MVLARTRRNNNFCICCIFWSLMISSPVFIILAVSHVGAKPRFYIQEFHIPAFNNSDKFNASNLNTSIFIDVEFKRTAALDPNNPVRYEDVKITLFYGSNTRFSVGYGVIPQFGPSKKKSVYRKAVVEARGLPWEDAIREISGGLTVALAVELATKYSEMRCSEGTCYYTTPKAVAAAAEVRVDGSGQKVSKKPIRFH